VVVIICIVIGIAADNGFKIYTYFWHFNNPSPIEWQKLKIKVPSALVAKRYSDDTYMNRLKVFLPAHPAKATIFFSPSSATLDNLSFEKGIRDLGYKVLEKKPCNILGHSCLRLKSIRKREESLPHAVYVEDVFFKKFEFRISFIGLYDHRHYLLEVIEDLVFIGKGTIGKV